MYRNAFAVYVENDFSLGFFFLNSHHSIKLVGFCRTEILSKPKKKLKIKGVFNRLP